MTDVDVLIQLSELVDRTRSLEERSLSLAERLEQFAAGLRDQGRPVPSADLDALTQHRIETLAIQRDITSLGARHGIQITEAANPNCGLLRRQLEWLDNAARPRVSRILALRILAEAGSLRTLLPAEHGILEPYLSRIEEVRAAIDSSDDSNKDELAHDVVSRTHPIVALLDLVRLSAAAEMASHTKLEELRIRVQDVFGSQLVWAAIWRQLAESNGAADAAEVLVPSSEPPEKTAVEIRENIVNDTSTPESVQFEVPVLPPLPLQPPVEPAIGPTHFDNEVGELLALLQSREFTGLEVAEGSATDANATGRSATLKTAIPTKRIAGSEHRAHLYAPRSNSDRSVRPAGIPANRMFDASPLAEIPAALDSVGLAQRLRQQQTQPRRSELLVLTFQLIAEGQLPLAFHFADHIAAAWPDRWPQVSPQLLAAVCLAPELTQPTGSLAEALSELYSEIPHEPVDERDTWDGATHLLVIATTLGAALLAPSTTLAVESLERACGKISLSLPLTVHLCGAIVDFSLAGSPLDPSLLHAAKDAAAWEEESGTLKRDISNWWERAPKATIKYAPSTAVWLRWLRADGVLYELIELLRRGDSGNSELIAERIATLSKPTRFERLVHDTDRRINGRHRGADIHGRALESLHNHTQEAVRFAQRWLALQKQRPGRSSSHASREQAERQRARLTETEALRDVVVGLGPRVLEEVSGALAHSRDIRPRFAAIHELRRAIERILNLFAARTPPAPTEPELSHILHSVLLRSPAIALHDDWSPVDSPGDCEPLLAIAAAPTTDWLGVFNTAEQKGDHQTTGRLIEYLNAGGGLTGALTALEGRRATAIEECRKTLATALYDKAAQIEEAAVLGRIHETERLELVAQLEGLEIDLMEGQIENFQHANGLLRHVADRLEFHRAEGRRRLFEALRAAGVGRGHFIYPKVQEALDQDDFLTAYEYLGIARDGQDSTGIVESALQSPTKEDGDPFDELSSRLGRWEKELGRGYRHNRGHTERQLIERLRTADRQSNPELQGVSLAPIKGKRAQEAADLLTDWYALKQRLEREGPLLEDDEKRLVRILEHIGFQVRELTLTSDSPLQVHIRTAPIVTRLDSLVPTFGSTLDGHYQLTLYGGRPNEEKMITDLGDSLAETSIVLYFGLFSERKRRDMGRLCREQQRSVIILDDIVLLNLCTVRGSRLRALFGGTLPFTYAQPYSTHPGTVAPEMFYGRIRERSDISHRLRGCFIYGGRQLGKTALLKRVRETDHEPDAGKIAIWVDLNAAGVGTRNALEHLWFVLANELAVYDVFPAGFHPSGALPEAILGHIEKWLAQDSRRQILFLLDEADIFLQRDGVAESRRPEDAFKHCTLLKGAIDRTNTRFKVVFAGLHNIVRTTRSSNNPLSHFGTPICVGPLFENGEAKSARELIEQPLRALGYRFKDRHLLWRILYRTNYYPSLIQLYCANLLNWMNSEERLRRYEGPPYEILSTDIEHVYRSSELREEIRRRFRMTLDLDARYEVIAYSIALAIRWETGSRGLEEGFDASRLLSEALDWWPEGFLNVDAEIFLALLDEMVGLGVLRLTGNRRYSLRSPNVLLLLGSSDDIVDALQRRRQPPVEYAPATFRGPYASGLDGRLSMRSQLTEQQLSALLRTHDCGNIFVVCGTEAAGLSDFGRMLHGLLGQHYWPLAAEASREQFEALVAQMSTRENAPTILHVPSSAAWNQDWIASAKSGLGDGLTSPRKQGRVVFDASPEQLRQLLTDSVSQSNDAESVQLLSMRPWHGDATWNWVEQLNESACGTIDPDIRAQIASVTGGWPLLLASLFCLAREIHFDWAAAARRLEQTLDHPQVAARLLRSFGIQLDTLAGRVLALLATWDSSGSGSEGEALSKKDIVELLGDVALDDVSGVLDWASHLALVSTVGRDRWVAGKVPARVIRTASSLEAVSTARAGAES